VQAAFSAVVGAMLSFFIFISPGSAQQTGCENGVVQLPAGINGTLTICSATASDLEAIRIQLARLSAIASHSSDQQFEVAKFINEIHAAAQLLNDKGRETLLAQSVADLLKKEQGRSDEGMLREIENISNQIADLRERIDEKGRQANSASQTQQAIAGAVGDGIAHLDIERANQAFDAIGRIETKEPLAKFSEARDLCGGDSQL